LTDIRVRFAPSPTGYVHIGGLRTALYNYLFARKHDGIFVLRIEDTDRARYVEGATENLIEVLKWAGLLPDEGPVNGGPFSPYFQSQRTQFYRKAAEQLIESRRAYYAFDTPEELQAMRERLRSREDPNPRYNASIRGMMRNGLTMSAREVDSALHGGTPYVIRLFIPENRRISVKDVIRGEVHFDSREVDDQVLIKSDGYPTYHLANVVDDHMMEISHVIRGEEWLSSVPKHLLLYEALGWKPPVFAHLPLISNPDGSKMSKRDITSIDGSSSGKVDPDVASYLRRGYEKEALLNYIALLGWNPGEGDERQVFKLDELIGAFSLKRVNKAAAIFDRIKLDWLNAEHLKTEETGKLIVRLKPGLAKLRWPEVSDLYLGRVIELMKSRLHFFDDFFQYADYFFIDPERYDQAVVKKRWKDDSAKLLLEFCDEISKLNLYCAEALEETLRKLAEKHDVGGGRIIHPVRLAVSGVGVGPSLFEMLEVLGKERVTRRLRRGAEEIPKLR